LIILARNVRIAFNILGTCSAFERDRLMARTAILFGLLLVGVTLATIGVNGGFKSGTVFIPAAFGALIAGLGIVAMKDSLRMHAMHAAAAIGLLGGLACLGMGIRQLTKIGTETQPSPSQFGSVWSTAMLCLVFVFLCVQSFIRAKRERLAKAGNSQGS
jgi:hypothetical protein